MNIFADMGYSVGAVLVMSSFISFLGFLTENIWLAARKKYIDNRNMHAPFLFGYGIAVTGFYFIMGTPSNFRFFSTPSESSAAAQFIAYSIFTFILVSLGEMLLGTVIEKTCGLIWWDYTAIPLHITRYTSIPTSLGFTIIIVTFMDCFYEKLMNRLMGFDANKMLAYGIFITAIMTIDLLLSMIRMKITGKLMTTWKLDFENHCFLRCKYRYKNMNRLGR